MTTLPIPAKSAAQIEAEFATAFADVLPLTKPKPISLADRLKPYRKAVLNQRKRGLTWKQIAEVMCKPPISFQVGETLLRRVFAKAEKKRAKPNEAPKPPKIRTIRDPKTREVIAQVDKGGHVELIPNSGPSPMTLAEEKRFQPLLDGLVPAIVVTKMTRMDARSYAGNAVELWSHAEAERFQHVLTAELDTLNESNCGRYGLAPATIAPFKRRWA